MLNILSFTYMHPDMVNRAAQIMHLGPEAIDQLADRYVLLNHTTNEYTHDVVIHEIPYDDFLMNTSTWALECLGEIEKKSDSLMFDKMFPRSMDKIKTKILNTIYFAMDKVYKCDTMLVAFADRIKPSNESQLVPRTIYTVLQESFQIVSDYTTGYEHHVIIKKRSDEHG